MNLIMGITIPLWGTAAGASMVLFIKNALNCKLEKLLLGSAAGIMIAASVWSLLLPCIEASGDRGVPVWLPAAAGFLFGVVFLMLLDDLFFRLHAGKGQEAEISSVSLLILAVTLHNIPEGMAVGVVFAGALMGDGPITMAGAMVLALGIAIQNFPEGAIISLPLRNRGMSRGKSFFCGVLSGVVEPVGAAATVFLTRQAALVLPYFLSFAAGVMIYVVVEELIPESQTGEDTRAATVGAALGFVLMMMLDVALG